LLIGTRSVDTKRLVRAGTVRDDGRAPEWRQFTFGRLLLFVFNAYETRMLESYRAGGFPEVRQVHLNITRHIDVPGGTRIGDLAARAGVTKGAMGQLAAECERLGLVEFSPDPGDARAKIVVLSLRGRKLLALTKRASKRIEAEFAKLIGADRFAAVIEGIIALRERMTDG
jgi:DNA-binding MarR family transcriptional regulator